MSISGLTYGVVRVEEPGSITSLTLQDVGMVMPGGRLRLSLIQYELYLIHTRVIVVHVHVQCITVESGVKHMCLLGL